MYTTKIFHGVKKKHIYYTNSLLQCSKCLKNLISSKQIIWCLKHTLNSYKVFSSMATDAAVIWQRTNVNREHELHKYEVLKPYISPNSSLQWASTSRHRRDAQLDYSANIMVRKVK